MGRSNFAVELEDDQEEDFDIPSQIAILRRAVAEIEIGRESPRGGLGTALQELARVAVLAEQTVTAIALADLSEEEDDDDLADACAVALFGVRNARRMLEQLRAPRPSRARLEAIRRKLHASLASLGEAFALCETEEHAPSTDLERALHLRNLVSDVYGAIPFQNGGPTSRVWALLVANAELKILLKSSSFESGFEAPKTTLTTLVERISGWQAKRPNPSSTSQLYTELVGVSSVLSSLSARPEVKRHDTRALVELSALLARRTFNDTMTERAVDVLASLRGMDGALDRLIVALPLDPLGVLTLVLRRVTELRARALAS